jgi:CTP-dependent riboflavin kinase
MAKELSWTALTILAQLDRFERDHTRPNHSLIADIVACSRRTVIRRIAELERSALIKVDRTHGPKRQIIAVKSEGRRVLQQWRQ